MEKLQVEEIRKYLDEKFENLESRLNNVEEGLKKLDDSINRTEDETKPSLRMKVSMLASDIAQIKTTLGKVWTIVAVPPISVVLGYFVVKLLGKE